jgi:Catenin-beta-like, Arm-motif containing nuclear
MSGLQSEVMRIMSDALPPDTRMHMQFKDNMEMRMKYSEEPSKFMESEVDLDDAVKRMMVIPGSPELYPDFARTQVQHWHYAAVVPHAAKCTRVLWLHNSGSGGPAMHHS